MKYTVEPTKFHLAVDVSRVRNPLVIAVLGGVHYRAPVTHPPLEHFLQAADLAVARSKKQRLEIQGRRVVDIEISRPHGAERHERSIVQRLGGMRVQVLPHCL